MALGIRLCALAAAGFLVAGSAGAQRTVDYHGRKAWALNNGKMRVLITPGGGHVASMTLQSGRGSNLNPFWLPKWQSVEPGVWAGNPAKYGGKPAAQLLSSILGHNICVDFFGAPSAPETAAGLPVHGEAPTVNWRRDGGSSTSVSYSTVLPMADMRVSRTVRLAPGSSGMWITETVENQTPFDRPFGWQQHPSFGQPFLESGTSFFDMPATQSTVYPKEFSKGERLKRGGHFDWPEAPTSDGGTVDLREWPKGNSSSDYTASIIDPSRQWAYFTAINTRKGLLVGYIWPRKDWPWVGNWEENRFRSGDPWKKREVVRGMEFGTTPFPDSRRDAVTMAKLFGTPTYRWISAKGKQTIGYGVFLASIPAGTTGVRDVKLVSNSVSIELEGVDKTITVRVR
jgi:hypothetical protein